MLVGLDNRGDHQCCTTERQFRLLPTRALEQGKIDRRQAAAATKVRLVNPH